ncbi:MAG TPA: hypothetical protein VFU22_29525 [Roseiflexaceae bacterium]|nr:hypothetical protein [Roseiflexaceae bacterium]
MSESRSTTPPNATPTPQPTNIRSRDRYQVYSGYQDVDAAKADTPYLVAPKTDSDADTKLTIANLCLTPPAAPPIAPELDNDDFQFAWIVPDTRGKPVNADDVKLLITIKKAKNVWRASAAARQALRANFVSFCNQVEALELSKKMLVVGGAMVITQRIAEALPVPIGDSLLYRAGFNPGFGADNSPYVDLQPGMRLRVDFAANQFVGPGSQLNGLVGSGQFYFNIGRDNNQRIVFDTFLSAIAAPETSAPLDQSTASGAIDLQAAGAARRHYRLFYPTQLPAATGPGDSRLTRNVALIGADTLPDLAAATDIYQRSGSLAVAAKDNLPIIGISFRGRAIAVPEIGVYVNRQVGDMRHSALTYVPIGTTLRQLLDQQAGVWNPGQLYGESGTITLRRFWAEDDGVPKYRKIMLNPVRATDVRVFDLPLAKSDILDIRFSMEN